jgi:hypothetical protein
VPILLDSQLSNGLADVAIVMNDLADAHARVQQVQPVLPCAATELLMIDDLARLGEAERVAELVQEHRNATRQLVLGRLGAGSLADPLSRALDDLGAIRTHKSFQHGETLGGQQVKSKSASVA